MNDTIKIIAKTPLENANVRIAELKKELAESHEIQRGYLKRLVEKQATINDLKKCIWGMEETEKARIYHS